MTLRLPDDANDALRAQAEKEGRSMRLVVCDAIREYVAHRSAQDHADRVRESSVRGADRYAEALRRLGDA